MHNGLFLTDDTSSLSKHNVSAESIFHVKLQKKEGCFSADTLIAMADGR
jgi:hypothetical protein